MKKLLSLFILLFSTFSLYAVTKVRVGSNALIYPYKFAGETYIVLEFENDEDNRLVVNSTIRLLLFDGSIMVLVDDNDENKETKQIGWGLGLTTRSQGTYYAVYPISQEQLQMLKKGVKKVAINTLPEVYIREYEEDEIGNKLNLAFSKLPKDF